MFTVFIITIAKHIEGDGLHASSLEYFKINVSVTWNLDIFIKIIRS